MSGLAIPAPGGSVTLPRFGVMALGAAAGIVAFNGWIGPSLPPALVNWSLGPINGALFWTGAAALIGGAGASMVFSKFGK